jgi:PAS domain S-box-containing protein
MMVTKSRAAIKHPRRDTAAKRKMSPAPPALKVRVGVAGSPVTVNRREDLHPVPYLLLSFSGVISDLNDAATKLIGRARSEMMLRPFHDLLLSREAIRFQKFIRQSEQLNQEITARWILRAAHNGTIPVQMICRPALNRNGRTFFRTALLDLREGGTARFGPYQPNFESLLTALDGIIWEAKQSMHFTYVCENAERILGYPTEEWTRDPEFWGRNIHVDDRERVLEARRLALRERRDQVLEYRLVASDHRTVWVRDAAVIQPGPVAGANLAGIMTDITEFKERAEQLQHEKRQMKVMVREVSASFEQSLKSVETFCSGIAHDVRAPLRAIKGFADVVFADHPELFTAQAREYGDKVLAGVERLAKLMDALTAYGRAASTSLTVMPAKLEDALQHAEGMLAEEIERKQAVLTVKGPFPRVLANPSALKQVFISFLSNALKFTQPGHPPHISVYATVPNRPEQEAVVRVVIVDNGIGLSAEAQARLFTLFQTLHRPSDFPADSAGLGIGLAIVKRTIEMMHGHVGVYSQPGEGSSFWFELPRVAG